MYTPNLGTWMQRDPAEDGFNLYGYAGENPLLHVDPFGLRWGAVGDWKEQWKKGESAFEATCDCDTLVNLAEALTGKKDDAKVLLAAIRATATQPAQPITVDKPLPAGTVVNVKRLLDLLDERLRTATVAAANNFTGLFGETLLGHDLELLEKLGRAETVEDYFKANVVMPAPDCQAAAYLILSRAFLETMAFTGRRPSANYIINLLYNPEIDDVKKLRKGDMARFANDSDYANKHPDGPWQSEFVITMDAGKTFWGNLDERDNKKKAQTYDSWKTLLREAYNAGGGRQIRDVPGYDKKETKRFNVGDIGMRLFSIKYGTERLPATKPVGK